MLVFSSQRDYPLRSFANPCPIVRNGRSSGLEGRQSTGDQTLAHGPAAGFHSSLPSPPDLGHFHCAVDEQRRMLGRKQRGETCRYQRYQQSLCGLKVMFANQISGD
ncbi:hypothetical protein NQZ68_020402 [Dissostichus eleginoides]|nr:hypothetical protein NQZ68_020402 [Dissostichus eleginoides]